MSELPPGLAAIIDLAAPLSARFHEAGHRLYLVGGVVRDHLLARPGPERDIDATTTARPREIKAIVGSLADAVWAQGEQFGTIGCTVDGQTYEITTHRAESYDPVSRKPTIAFGDDITDDLARRDFTVNAMAVDIATGDLIDPHGGRADLEAGVLRTPLDPELSLSEDPLRILRAARFRAGYDLGPVPELLAAIAAMAGRMAIVSTERIRDELTKLLLLDRPGSGLRLLAETGLLGRVAPSLADLSAEEADHLGRRVAAVAPDVGMRWSVLLFEPMKRGAVTSRDLLDAKFSRRLTADIAHLLVYLSVVEGRLHVSPRSARAEAARAVGSGRPVDDYLAFMTSLRRFDGTATDDLDGITRIIEDLRSREPDFDDPAPVLTGDEVCAALSIEPGPAVGDAMGLLARRRMAEGPIGKQDAIAWLRDRWASRADG